MERRPLLLAWGAGATFGWGVAGLNIFRQLALRPDVAPLMARPIRDLHLDDQAPGPLRQLLTAVLDSNTFAEQIAAAPPGPLEVQMPVVHSLGNQFQGSGTITGMRNIGRLVFEDTDIAGVLPRLDRFDAVVCASNWNADILRAQGVANVQVIHETVDHALFHPPAHPDAKTGLVSPDRFHIFTGGKIEFRKGQDLVVEAFREFSRRHDDAVLVTAWHSPWPQAAEGFQGRLDAPVRLGADGRIDVARWVAENGVDPAKVIDLGINPNPVMPVFLRQMDCALQPSRAEGGTNFVAMEAMACGAPVILARNTGVADLVKPDNCIALEHQSPVTAPTGWGTAGWGESDVEEILQALEALYASRELRARIGANAAQSMRGLTWAGHAAALKRLAFSA